MENYVKFETFVNVVMKKLLEGDDHVLESLRRQYESASVKSCDFTGVGFYISYSIPENAPRIQEKKSFQIGDLLGQIEGVNDGVGFILFINDGVIDLLEGYTYGDEKWPNEVANYELSYISGLERDIEKLIFKWQ